MQFPPAWPPGPPYQPFGRAQGRTRKQTLETNADLASLRWHRSALRSAGGRIRSLLRLFRVRMLPGMTDKQAVLDALQRLPENGSLDEFNPGV
jgi:hypothetical protein